MQQEAEGGRADCREKEFARERITPGLHVHGSADSQYQRDPSGMARQDFQASDYLADMVLRDRFGLTIVQHHERGHRHPHCQARTVPHRRLPSRH